MSLSYISKKSMVKLLERAVDRQDWSLVREAIERGPIPQPTNVGKDELLQALKVIVARPGIKYIELAEAMDLNKDQARKIVGQIPGIHRENLKEKGLFGKPPKGLWFKGFAVWDSLYNELILDLEEYKTRKYLWGLKYENNEIDGAEARGRFKKVRTK